MVEKERYEEFYNYFISVRTDNIAVVMKALGDAFTEEVLRLARIKFISELAS